MYSIVLMAALTTGVDVPDLGHKGGGCCGGGCYGGSGGGRHSRHGGGCCGCSGGGGGCGGGYGGGCMGSGMGMSGGCMGSGMGYGGCMGSGRGLSGGTIMPYTAPQGTGGEKLQNKPTEKGGRQSMVPAPATILVDLPADAKLSIDNAATTSIGTSRVFQSPELNPGKVYHYTLKAEVVRNGNPVRVEQVVEVSAGETTPVRLTLPATSVAQR
jgi:uncharacterized protein (TIGR03000 family)